MIPDSFIDKLRDASDIEQVISSYVRLTRKGRTLTGLCPFHSEKTPSFTVYTDNQSYYCFGCQSGGDVITFIRQIENLEYIEALRLLAERAGLTLPESGKDDGTARLKARILEINRAAARFFHEILKGEQGAKALAYLAERGLTRKTLRRFGLGCSPDSWDSLTKRLIAGGFAEEELIAAAVSARGKGGRVYDQFRGRVMFPILDLRGNVIGFGGRSFGDGQGPKYLNSPDTPVFKKSRGLYALNFAKAVKSDVLLLAEGYMDVIALHQAGFENAVATLGTSLTQEQARLISQYAKKVVIAYDSDGAGQNAAKRAIKLFSQTDLPVSVLELREAKDPDEYIRKFGARRFAGLIAGSKNALAFETDKLRARYDLTDPDGKTAFLNEYCGLIADLGNPLQRDVYISEIARELGAGKERLLAAAEAIRKKRMGEDKRRQSKELRVYPRQAAASAVAAHSGNVDLAVQVAERNLLAMLIQNPDYYDDIRSKITDKDFTQPENAEIFSALSALLEQRRIPELIHLSSRLTPRQMATLSGMTETCREIQFYREQADEFIKVLKRNQITKSPEELAAMTPRQLDEYINSQRAGK